MSHIARYSHQTFLEAEKRKINEQVKFSFMEISGICTISLLVIYNYHKAAN